MRAHENSFILLPKEVIFVCEQKITLTEARSNAALES